MRMTIAICAAVGVLTGGSEQAKPSERLRAIDDVAALSITRAEADANVGAAAAQDPSDAMHAAEVLRSSRGAPATL